MGVKNTVLLGCQLLTVAFSVLAQLRGSRVDETEISAALFTKLKLYSQTFGGYLRATKEI